MGSFCAGEVVEVPNTVYAYWAGDANCLGFGKWYVGWSRDIAYLKARGFLAQRR